MGIDLRSIAVPLESAPVRAIRDDAALWAEAEEWPPFGRAWGDESPPEISRALLAVVPAGARWVEHFGDRSFTQAEHLLDPPAYRAATEAATPHHIIFGAEAFAEHAVSGQGFPWRCSMTAFLATAVERIDGLDVAAVRREFSVAEMDALGLYKVDPDERDDDALARVLAELRAFAERCRAAVAADLDLIITRY